MNRTILPSSYTIRDLQNRISNSGCFILGVKQKQEQMIAVTVFPYHSDKEVRHRPFREDTDEDAPDDSPTGVAGPCPLQSGNKGAFQTTGGKHVCKYQAVGSEHHLEQIICRYFCVQSLFRQLKSLDLFGFCRMWE
ncbi:hypothetical protein CDAR_224931 [Caerostris darwini]|uniref:Uncharacterized protein n=1 Tax=Caerostris darwini TaxID=1538125 RepID=A0AAV4N9P2_9ARAC|nr:hypothetical protein CDAR_224931 [Caerostris darwini]